MISPKKRFDKPASVEGEFTEKPRLPADPLRGPDPARSPACLEYPERGIPTQGRNERGTGFLKNEIWRGGLKRGRRPVSGLLELTSRHKKRGPSMIQSVFRETVSIMQGPLFFAYDRTR